MVFVLGNVLDQAEVAALREAATALPYKDGRATAGRYARGVKRNEQAAKSDALSAVLSKATEALSRHEVFRSVARPRKFVRTLVSRYGPGMEYGTHVDDAIMAGARTDMSFTLFLSPLDSYEGGGLIMEEQIEDRRFRLEPGDAVLYPTSVLHRVEGVTSGERLAIVGWIQSWVRDPARREVLHDLDVAADALFRDSGKTPHFDRLLKAKANLYRMWAEG
ncbi:Fe2+-dependent dioxygenase [Brevirhabdus pacifica]|uniref:Fe2+-dependent dioxygenase n=1 Tax=Brevirhabdus pacifica TaxID=1267768 RepID=A0A1U7DKB6_9RHOB|nr:Fe2+-dependent dioxygenase [Brevirhabdus pacifica]APX90430.1 Fe2+-dependent dioxygenase [Brevirhabdus pacifica]OWU78550.1 hypothetical protein ATO5_07060 [Loktanella sp. 22II-4b]PJJ85473.1 PKHD-type hydroxylase [Brevirhabdus pacifica]